MPNVYGIVDDILVIRYDKNRADHDAAIHKGAMEMQRTQLKIKQRKMLF